MQYLELGKKTPQREDKKSLWFHSSYKERSLPKLQAKKSKATIYLTKIPTTEGIQEI